MFVAVTGNPQKEIELKVQDPDPSHVGRNIVTLDKPSKDALFVTSGDIVEIEGSRKTAAVIWPARTEDEGKGIIRMDNFLRHNAGTNLGERVRVRRAEVKEAKKVVLAPTQEVRIIASGYDRILKKNFIGRPLVRGDSVWISVFGSGFVYSVLDTTPRGIVKVNDFTQFVLKEQPAKQVLDVPRIAYEDIGGLKEQVTKVREMIELPMRHPELFRRLGINPPKGVLLYGPPGTGKTLLAKAVANETNAHFISVAAPALMSKFVGEAEERIRQVFKEAEDNSPSIIFFDEIDAVAPKRDEVIGEVERRVVAQLLASMDGMEARGNVIVIAATNRVNSIDEALRRPGRFDREIEFPVPDKNGRTQVLQIHTRGMPLSKEIDLEYFSSITHGFVGADLEALVKESAMKALRRYLPKINLEEDIIPPEVLENLEVNKRDFLEGLKDVQPSALREVTIEVPNVKWSQVGSLEGVKQELKQAIEWPLKNPGAFKKMGIKPPKGVLLYGPPGCGKTLLARAVATESEANFISIKGPELVSMWVGESLPFDEELLVFDGKKIFREQIGKIVEEKRDLQVVTFDNDGRVLFSKIADYIAHPLNGKMLELVTETGRKIRVTDKHSVFSLVENEIQAVTANQLVEGKSVIAIPSKLPNISTGSRFLNLIELFSNQSAYFVRTPQISWLIKKLGYVTASKVLHKKTKCLYNIVDKKLPIKLSDFLALIQKTSQKPDWSSVRISRKGARHSLPVLFPLSESFFELLGLWVAEGDFNNEMIRFTVFEREIRSKLLKNIESLGLTWSERKGHFIVNSTTFHDLFVCLGLESGAFRKKIPPFLFTSSNVQTQAFLRGYFSGDGTIQSNGHSTLLEATTVSKALANDLLYLLLKQGIVARCKTKKEWSGSISFRIRIFGIENLKRFQPAGFIDSKRNGLLNQYIVQTQWKRSNVIPINEKIRNLLNEAFVHYPNNQTVGVHKVREALVLVDSQKQRFGELWKLCESDIYWDVVTQIREVEYAGSVFDIAVEPCQNFVAGFGGIFAHNSEKGIRNIFKKARQVAPVIVFFDEFDSIASRRGSTGDSGVGDRVVNQLLTELDGVESLKDVVFIAATNRPDLIDPSILRPGRIDKLVSIPPPSEKARLAILKVHSKDVPLGKDVVLEELAKQTRGFSGADLQGLIQEAALDALQESKMKATTVEKKHFDAALKKMVPTISSETEEAYAEFKVHQKEFKPSYIE